jgi:hypothetical protein
VIHQAKRRAIKTGIGVALGVALIVVARTEELHVDKYRVIRIILLVLTHLRNRHRPLSKLAASESRVKRVNANFQYALHI